MEFRFAALGLPPQGNGVRGVAAAARLGYQLRVAGLDWDPKGRKRFEVYKAVSQQIREIFAEHTPIIEPLSLDEAYLDVTENLQGIPLARDVALAIRAKIKEVNRNWICRSDDHANDLHSHGGNG